MSLLFRIHSQGINHVLHSSFGSSAEDPGTLLLSVSNQIHIHLFVQPTLDLAHAQLHLRFLSQAQLHLRITVRTTCLPTCTSVVQASPWPSDHRRVINRESSLGQNNISVGRDEPWYDIRFIIPKSQVPGHSVRVWTSWLRSSGSDQHIPEMVRHC